MDFYLKDLFLNGLISPMVYIGLVFAKMIVPQATQQECATRAIRIEDDLPPNLANEERPKGAKEDNVLVTQHPFSNRPIKSKDKLEKLEEEMAQVKRVVDHQNKC